MSRNISIDGTVIPVMSIDYTINRNQITEDAFNRVTQTKIYGGTYSATGSLSAAYRPIALGTLTNMVLGNTNGQIDSTNSDFIGSADNITDGVVILINDDYTSGYYKFVGCMLNAMELTLNANEYAKVTYNWIGRYMDVSGTAITPDGTEYDDAIPVFYNATLTYSSAIKVKGLTLRIERPIEPQFAIGSEYARKFVQSGAMTVSGSLTLASSEYAKLLTAGDTDDQTHPDIGTNSHTNVNNISKNALTITLQAPDGGSTLQTITIGNVGITSSSLSMQGRNPEDKKLDWVAVVDSDDDVAFSGIS